MISKRKKALLHVAKAQLGLEDWMYRQVLLRHAGVKSSADPRMDNVRFNNVMAEFENLGFRNKQTRPKNQAKGKVTGGASTNQIDLIQDLWHQITGHRKASEDFKATIYSWMVQHFPIHSDAKDYIDLLNKLDARTAHIVINILKKMKIKRDNPGN